MDVIYHDHEVDEMRVLLINADNHAEPNLFLMKISAWVKAQGGEAGFNIEEPTHAFISCVFKQNKARVESAEHLLKLQYPNIIIDKGGTGYDMHKRHVESELIYPDYSLYDMDHDLGFTSRGCIRNCHFCIVREKEGTFKPVQHPREFHDPTHKSVVLMDNNILANEEWFMEVADYLIENNLKVDFNQGLDIRLMVDEIAEKLAQLRPIQYWRFAYDLDEYTDQVKMGIDMLKRAGINTRSNCLFYVYVHDDNNMESAIKRCELLREWDVTPYPMFNLDAKRTQRMTNLKRWARPMIFWTTPTFAEYKR